MKRLHIGDIVKFEDWASKGVGVITEISKYNNDSIDKCEYSVSYESRKLEREADVVNTRMISAETISGGSSWFSRQELTLIRKNDIKTYEEEDD